MSLWKKIQSFLLIWIGSPRTRSFKLQDIKIGTSFYTCKKASLTVEAAIVIPLTAGFLATILFLFQVIAVQVAVDEALMYAGRKVAVESSIISTDEVLFVSAETLFLTTLEGNPVIEEYVDNGRIGVTLFESDFYEKEFLLRANYVMNVPIGFFGTIAIPLYSQNIFRKWTGDSYVGEAEAWVYITPYGIAYHATENCQSLDITLRETTLSEIKAKRGINGQKYYKCSRCRESSGNEKVYYTDYGSLYHTDASCSALKRTINKIPLSQVGSRSKCNLCY